MQILPVCFPFLSPPKHAGIWPVYAKFPLVWICPWMIPSMDGHCSWDWHQIHWSKLPLYYRDPSIRSSIYPSIFLYLSRSGSILSIIWQRDTSSLDMFETLPRHPKQISEAHSFVAEKQWFYYLWGQTKSDSQILMKEIIKNPDTLPRIGKPGLHLGARPWGELVGKQMVVGNLPMELSWAKPEQATWDHPKNYRGNNKDLVHCRLNWTNPQLARPNPG